MEGFDFFKYFDENKSWLLSGVGVSAIGALWARLRYSGQSKDINASTDRIVQNFSITQTNGKEGGVDVSSKNILDSNEDNLGNRKESTRILFVDDDSRFRVVKILQNSGWRHTKTIKDVKTLDAADVKWADILFIDVQGVGVALGFNDEGLGLSLAIKDKYPEKKVVIYSAENKGDRFHNALRSADSFLSKNADPYQFQKIVEDLTSDLV